MAIVVREDPQAVNLPGLKLKSFEVDLDNSYETGGEVWDLSAHFDVIKGAVFESKAGYHFELTSKDAPASAKIKVFGPGAAIKSGVKQGAAAGSHIIPGVRVGDTIVGAFELNSIPNVGSATQQISDLVNLSSEFIVKGTSVLSNTGGTATSSKDELLVLFAKPALQEIANLADLSAVTKIGILIWGQKF